MAFVAVKTWVNGKPAAAKVGQRVFEEWLADPNGANPKLCSRPEEVKEGTRYDFLGIGDSKKASVTPVTVVMTYTDHPLVVKTEVKEKVK